ncbi:MAG: hypothetical protein IT382_06035, partial [Deltaproteobacteria bacterium]|nr:hypothetical protein [Deltaproteobacteria bacterium]
MSKRVAISLTALFAVVALAFVGWVELSYRAARASGYGVTRSAIGRSPFGALLGCSAADDFARICGFAAEVNANPTHEEARLEAAIARLQATMCNRGMVTIFSAVATVSVKDKLRL